MKIKPWQILMIIVVGMGAFCLVCVSASLFVSMYSSLSASPTVLGENKSTAKNAEIPLPKETTETINQVTNTATEPSSPTGIFTNITILMLASTSDIVFKATTCIVNRNPQRGMVTNVVDGYTIILLIGNQTFPVCYTGIDTPEMDCLFGAQAKEQNAIDNLVV